MTSHYRTLGVDPEADPVVIRSAYLALIRRYHPDGGGAEADPARAQAVTAAWDVLRDPGRRAAYDDNRQARFQPGGAMAGDGVRVRGGAAGRNLFLLLAAGTLGLGWWALGQPKLTPPSAVVAADAGPEAPIADEPEIRPAEDREAMHRRIAVEERPAPLPADTYEPEVERPVAVAPPLAISAPVRLPTRSGEAPTQGQRRVQPAERTALAATDRAEARTEKRAAPAATRIDLAPLERHLQLLTDQSFRFGTEAKRARVIASREAFLSRLGTCDNDACKRDAYLRRNAEIGEIMRN